MLDATKSTATMRATLRDFDRYGHRLTMGSAALDPTTARTLVDADEQVRVAHEVLNATRIDSSTLAWFADVGRYADPFAALGAALDSGAVELAGAVHRQFGGITNALKACSMVSAVLPHEQLSETVRMLSMRPDLVEVAESAARLIQAVGLSGELAADIQRLVRSASRDDVFADLASPEDVEPLSPDSALHEIVEPSLEEADFSLLLIIVVIVVCPALLATATAYLTHAAQDLLFWTRLVGKVTQEEDAIPGVLLLAAIIGAIRQSAKSAE